VCSGMYAFEMQNSSQSLSLTIITCAMKFHEPFLVANYLGLRNFSKSIRWIIVNNDESSLDLPREIQNDTKVVIQKGPPLDTSYGPISIGVHHAKSLEIAAQQVKTNHALILDPDFVIINWERIIQEFNRVYQDQIVALGTPWFPTWYRKIVNSLAPHFVFIKTDIIQSGFEWYPIDKIPEYLKNSDSTSNTPRSQWPIFKIKIFKFALLYFFNRIKINTEYDTFGSTEILAKQNRILFLTPQLTRNQLAKLSPFLKYKVGRIFEKLIPRRFRYLTRHYSVAPFELSVSTQHIEHWVVGEEIFGVHMRSFGAGKLLSKDFSAVTEFGMHLDFLTGGRLTMGNSLIATNSVKRTNKT
jgi:hypothetical protein